MRQSSALKILLLHPNFPGQFRSRARRWADDGHDVRFICQTHFGRQIAGVHRICLKGKAGHNHLESQGLGAVDRHLEMARQYRIGFDALTENGWEPNLVLSHSGWGCGTHARLAFPKANQVGYVEWWFKTRGPDEINTHLRNQPMALELAECHQLVTPTWWQRAQLPPGVKQRCKVIGDGVDTDWFKPDPQKKATSPLLTYGTRGMEPTRGFPQFIQALPALLEAVPELAVEIAGEDRICYSGKPPSGYTGFGAWAKEQLQQWGHRVRFVGVLEPKAYRHWLQRSWLHVYLTKPFVASWSLLEAMACGCCVIGSNNPTVKEFTLESGAILVDTWQSDPRWLLKAAMPLLKSAEARAQLGRAARTLSLGHRIEKAHQEWGHVLGQGLTTQA